MYWIKIILPSFLICFQTTLYSQSKSDLKLEINTNKSTKIKTFYTLKKLNNPEKHIQYYWTIKRELHTSRGGYAGNLIHGEYVEFYASNQLFAQGNFNYGTKSNHWIYWHDNGQLKKVEYYKNGRLNGIYEEYNSKGVLIFSGKYKKGSRHGVFIKQLNDTLSYKETYKKGELKTVKRTIKIPKIKIKDRSKNKEKKNKKDLPKEEKTKKGLRKLFQKLKSSSDES